MHSWVLLARLMFVHGRPMKCDGAKGMSGFPSGRASRSSRLMKGPQRNVINIQQFTSPGQVLVVASSTLNLLADMNLFEWRHTKHKKKFMFLCLVGILTNNGVIQVHSPFMHIRQSFVLVRRVSIIETTYRSAVWLAGYEAICICAI